MSRKDNLRDPSRRARILAKRSQAIREIPVVNQFTGVAVPTIMERLKKRLSRSKYTPHFGAKQEAKVKRQAERDAIAAFE